jgi:hypothetical protein
MGKYDERTQVRAAQLYDFLQDEMRVFKPSVEESKVAIAMLTGAFISGCYNSDTEAAYAISELGDLIGEYYEKTKAINKRRQNQDREVIKLGDH